MLSTNDRPRSALHRIALRALAAVDTFVRHRILKPEFEDQPDRIEPGHMLSLTGFSGIWEQDVTNSRPAETRH